MFLSHLIPQLQLALFISFTTSANPIIFEGYQNGRCAILGNGMGECVKFTTCQSLRRIINWNLLQTYICGFAGMQPMVCCSLAPNDNDVTSPITVPTRSVTQTNLPPRTVSTIRQNRGNVIPDRGTRPQFLPKNCGMTFYVHSRVVGGQVAEKGAWPWMAVVFVITIDGTYSVYCGGSLVTDRHVITAAHCVVKFNSTLAVTPSQLRVRLGAHDITKVTEPDAIDIDVKEIRIHEEYEFRTFKNDIAVLRLHKRVTFSSHISPVCLPYDSLRNEDLAGKTATVVGFGRTSYHGPPSDFLLEASFEIWDQEICERTYEGELNITNVYLCAAPSDGSKSPCMGDSGGPLVVIGDEGRFYLVGVVSFGKLCSLTGFPAVYTRVTSFLNWLSIHLAT